MGLDLVVGLVLALPLGGVRQVLVPGQRGLRRGVGDRLLDLLQIDVVVLERGLHVRSEIGRARDLSRDGRRIGARLVDQLKHVLFLIGRSPARQQLTGFQVLESERSAELGPSHGDLLDLSISSRSHREPAAIRWAMTFDPRRVRTDWS